MLWRQPGWDRSSSGAARGRGWPDLGTVVTWIDEETLGLLIGMMVIVDVLAKRSLRVGCCTSVCAERGSIWRLSFILCTITAVFSAFLDNTADFVDSPCDDPNIKSSGSRTRAADNR